MNTSMHKFSSFPGLPWSFWWAANTWRGNHIVKGGRWAIVLFAAKNLSFCDRSIRVQSAQTMEPFIANITGNPFDRLGFGRFDHVGQTASGQGAWFFNVMRRGGTRSVGRGENIQFFADEAEVHFEAFLFHSKLLFGQFGATTTSRVGTRLG